MFNKKAGNVGKSADLIQDDTKSTTTANFMKNFLEAAKKDPKKYDLIDTGVPSNSYHFLSPQYKYKNLKSQVPPFIVHGFQITEEEAYELESTSP